jgi:serine/threonine protein kinase
MFKSKTIQSKGGKIFYIEKEIASKKSTKHSVVINEDGDSLICISLDLKKTTVSKKLIEQFYTKKNPMEEIQCPNSLKIYEKILSNGVLHIIISPFESTLEQTLLKKDKELNLYLAKKMFSVIDDVYARFKRFKSIQNVISLSNIFINKGEIIFGGWDLGDLGSELFFTNIGTSYYKAPELLEKIPPKDINYEKCDIWSIGVCLYSLCFGVLPFNGGDRVEVLYEIKNSKKSLNFFPLETSVSSEMKQIIEKMLHIERKSRLSVCDLKQSTFIKFIGSGSDLPKGMKSVTLGDKSQNSFIDRLAKESFKIQIDTNLSKSLVLKKGESLTTLMSSVKMSAISHTQSRINTGSEFKLSSEDDIDPALLQYLFEKNVIIFIMDCIKKLVDCQSSKKMHPLEEVFQILELVIIKKAFIQNYYITQIMQNRINIFNIEKFETHIESITYKDLLLFFKEFNDYTRQIFHKLKVDHLVSFPKNKNELANIEQYDMDALNKKMGIFLNIIYKFYKKQKENMNNLERHLVMQLLVYLLYAKNSAERFEFSKFSSSKDWVVFCSTLMNKSYVEIESVFEAFGE